MNKGTASWSKTGLIAYGDNHSVDANLCITFLETVNGTNWRFHPPKKYVLHPQLHEQQYLKDGSSSGTSKSHHFFYNVTSVHWNNWISLPGDLLAVCDELGNMTMILAGYDKNGSSTLDKLTVLFQDNVYKFYNQTLPLEDKVSMKVERKQTKKEYNTTIMDFQWIGSQKPLIAVQNATRDPSTHTFKNQVQQCLPYGVFHPTSIKSACIAVRRNGQLDFWYQFSNSKDHKKITLQLSPCQNQRNNELEWFQFAKIAHMNEDQTLLISAYSNLTCKFSFYKLHVNWNVNTSNPNAVNDPSLDLQFLLNFSPDLISSQGEILELEDYQVISRTYDNDSQPEVLMVYGIAGTSKSLVKKFHINQSKLSLSFTSIFSPLGNSNPESLKSPLYSIKHTGDLSFDSKVVEVDSHILDSIVTFRLHNGTVKVYNNMTWNLENDEYDAHSTLPYVKNVITSMFCAGFHYPKLPPTDAIEWCQISPSMGGIVAKLKLKSTPQYYTFVHQDEGDSTRDEMDAVVLAYGFVVSNHRQHSGEDLSIAMKNHVLKLYELDTKRAENFIVKLINTVYGLFGVSPDAPKEVLDKMIMSRPIQRLMLLQLELGSSFENNNIYNMSRVVMSLRNVLFAFNGVSRNVQVMIQHTATMNLQQSSGKVFHFAFSKQDLIYSLIPCAKWFVKFVTFLTQQMIVLVNNPSDRENNLVLGVFGAKMTRTLILSVLNEIKKIVQLVTKFPESSYPVLNESSSYLRKVLGDAPVNFEKFETFLVDVNNKFTSLSEQQPALSSQMEPSLIIKGEIPEEITQIKDFLLSYSNTAVLSHIKPADVYFEDTSDLRIFTAEYFSEPVFKLLQPLDQGLVIDDAKLPHGFNTAKSFSNIDTDDISNEKLVMDKNQKLKRCCRCGSVTRAGYTVPQDSTVVPTSISTKRWTNLYSKICVCSGFLYELE